MRKPARVDPAVAAALAMVVLGCSIGNIGWLRSSSDVRQAFETLQVSSDYRYWYLYLENSPYAVVGLDSEYRLEDLSWTEVRPGTEVFRKVVGLVESFPVPGSRTHGAYILNSRGEGIGVWYSSMNAGITIDPGTKVVFVTTDAPWLHGGGNDGGGKP